MLALPERSPDIYLDEIQEQMFEQHNITLSLSTISRTLKRLGISSKKVYIAPCLTRYISNQFNSFLR